MNYISEAFTSTSTIGDVDYENGVLTIDDDSSKTINSYYGGIPADLYIMIRDGIERGYIDACKYGHKYTLLVVSEENIYDLWNPKEVTKAQIDKAIKLICSRYKIDFKYKTTEEGVKELGERMERQHHNSKAYDPIKWVKEKNIGHFLPNPKKDRTPINVPGLTKEFCEMVERGIINGYLDGRLWGIDYILFAISKENIYDIFDPKEITKEQIDKIIDHVYSINMNFKYKTTKEGLKDMDDRQNKNSSHYKVVDPVEWIPEQDK